VDIKLIAGLGNPGKEYEGTRHNIGFVVADRIAASHHAREWRRTSNALVTDVVTQSGQKLLLVKPQSFMNRSGEPLAELMRFFKWSPGNLLVLHDEIDLPLGTLRVKSGGGDGGHNGVRSIAEGLGSVDFVRARLGVGRPAPQDNAAQPAASPSRVSGWVLGRFAKEELVVVEDVCTRGVALAEELLRGSIASAQQKFN